MRVFISFTTSDNPEQKRTKVIENVKTQYEAEVQLKEKFPGAKIQYTDVLVNGTDGVVGGRGLLLSS